MTVPISPCFVIKPKSGALPEGLDGEAAGSSGLFVSRPAAPGSDPRQGWQRLMRDYGDHIEFAAPVIVDSQGLQSLPTGKVVVQFHDPPSGPALQKFQDAYGLRFLQKNEFRPDQLSFESLDHRATYPPDLIDRLQHDPNIKLAAPETAANYRRV